MSDSTILTSKATLATIQLGNIEIDCFQMPDGSYGFEYLWLADLIERDKQILSNKKSPYYLKGIVGEALADQTIKIEGISASNNKKKYLKQNQLMSVLGAFAAIPGNQPCLDFLVACSIEALERRADQAFNVKRTEEERNERLAQRVIHADGWRKLFTDWQKLDGCLKGWQYADRVNQLKIAAKLPIDSISEYNARQVQIMNNAEVIYDAMRRSGMSHQAALKMI